MAYWHLVIMIAGGVETMWLSSLHTRNLIKWEPIWCAFCICIISAYRLDARVGIQTGRTPIGKRLLRQRYTTVPSLGRVVFVCWLQYMVDFAEPEAQWIKPEIANGEHVDWLRACGWMATR